MTVLYNWEFLAIQYKSLLIWVWLIHTQATLEELIAHGLRALQASLHDGELTDANSAAAIVGKVGVAKSYQHTFEGEPV